MELIQTGKLHSIWYSQTARGTMKFSNSAVVEANMGIIGDRYSTSDGSFSPKGNQGRCISIMDAKLVAAMGWMRQWTRRNLFVMSGQGKEPLDLTCALDMRDQIGPHIQIGDVQFNVEKYCTPCRVPDAMRKKDEPNWKGNSFQDTFAGHGGILLVPLNSGTIRCGDSFFQLSRGH